MKSLTLYDYAIIKEFLDKADYEGYNSNFVTMMMWNHEYHIEYEIHDHFLVMLHHYKDKQFWSMPFTTKEHYKDALDYMLKYSHDHHFDFVLDCAISSFVDEVKLLYGNKFLYKRTRYNDDYIYDKNMLMTLSGKKMQKRRNHYNYFLKNFPDYEYRDLDFINDFNDVLKCLSRWENRKDETSESIISEIYGIMYLLSSKDLLDVKAGGIYINGQMEAFIIASRLHHKTVQIHVEKANKDIRGLYPAILKELLEHHFDDCLYVNREEDMGLENLRKSKMALHPISMVEKYCIYENNVSIEVADDKDKIEIMNIWKDTFIDENEESTNFYFEKCYRKENTYLLKNNGNIVSGMQIVPFELKIENNRETVYFILGVFTKKEFENQGCMKMLMKHVLSLTQYKDKKIYLQAYNPEIYKSLGFNTSHLHQKVKIEKDYYLMFDKDIIDEDFSMLEDLYNKYVDKYDEYRIRGEEYFKWLIERSKAFNQSIKTFKYNNDLDGYCIYSIEDEVLYVSEIIYMNQDSLNRMIKTLLDLNENIVIECDMNAKIYGKTETVITMLSNYTLNKNYQNKYINEVY